MSKLLGKKYIFFELLPFCKFSHRKLDISKKVTARSFKLAQLIENNKSITWWKFNLLLSYRPLQIMS